MTQSLCTGAGGGPEIRDLLRKKCKDFAGSERVVYH